MSNELIEKSSFDIEFKPATIEMKRYDEMKDIVESFSEKYKGMVFTADEKKGAEAARSELLDLRNSLETERKNVKREYNKPLNEFETKIKDLTEMIDEPLDDIRDGIKKIEEGEREQRESHLETYLRKFIEDKAIYLEEIEVGDKWLNKGNFTSKLEPNAKLKKEIEQAVDSVLKEKENRAMQENMLNQFCKSKGIDSSGWVHQLDYKNATEIMGDINREEERRKEEQKRQEELEKQQAEKEEVKEQVEPESDIFEPIEPVEEPKPKTITNVIEVTGTVEKLNALADFCRNNGIEVDEVKSNTVNETLDDLPF